MNLSYILLASLTTASPLVKRGILYTIHPECQTLYAGQFTDVGTVCTTTDGVDLTFTYNTVDDWVISETHFWVGSGIGIAEMPQTKTGNPKPGNFPYSGTYDTATHEVVYQVPISSLGHTDVCGQSYAYAAHAVVAKINADGSVIQTETAWAGDHNIMSKGSWATYSPIEVSCPEEQNVSVPSPGGLTCSEPETAFAYDASVPAVNSFAALFGEKTRWGWYNGPIQFNSVIDDIPIYAGQHYFVGTMSINYTIESQVTISLRTLDGTENRFTEYQIYVGYVEPITASPGQYTCFDNDCQKSDVDITSLEKTFNLPEPDTALYIIAHVNTCHAKTHCVEDVLDAQGCTQ